MGFSGKEPLLGDKKPSGICRGRLPHILTLVGIFAVVYICFWSYGTRLNNIELEDQVRFYKGILRNMTDRMSRISDRCNRDIRLLNQSADNLKQCCSSRNEQERIAFDCNSKLVDSAEKCRNQMSQQSEQMTRMEQESNAKLQTCLKKLNSNDFRDRDMKNLQGHSREGQGIRNQNLGGENSSKLPNIPPVEGHSREGQGVRGQNLTIENSRQLPNIPPVEGRGLGQPPRGRFFGLDQTSNIQKGQSLNNRDQKLPNNTISLVTPSRDNFVKMATNKADNATEAIKTTVFIPLKDAVGLAVKTVADQLREAKSEKGVSKPPDGKKSEGIAPLGDLDDYDDNYNEGDDVKKGQSSNKIQGLKTSSPTGVVSNETGKGQKGQEKPPSDKDNDYQFDK